MTIIVNAKPKSLRFATKTVSCRLGKAGFIAQILGREGDGKTPLGQYILRFGLYRADRLPCPSQIQKNLKADFNPLFFRPLRPDDGWCDDPKDPAYNRFIRRPYPASHEALWREDGAYDIILVMSHNDSPPQPGMGSAVFIHIAQADDRATLGCIALAPEDMVILLPHLEVGMGVNIAT